MQVKGYALYANKNFIANSSPFLFSGEWDDEGVLLVVVINFLFLPIKLDRRQRERRMFCWENGTRIEM